LPLFFFFFFFFADSPLSDGLTLFFFSPELKSVELQYHEEGRGVRS
jgi:hypothetical protein